MELTHRQIMIEIAPDHKTITVNCGAFRHPITMMVDPEADNSKIIQEAVNAAMEYNGLKELPGWCKKSYF